MPTRSERDKPSELVFKATIASKRAHQIVVTTKTVFRTEELIVKTPDDFGIKFLLIGDVNRIPGGAPAIAFAESAHPEARRLPGYLAMDDITLIVENESDEERVFEAVLKGKVAI